MKAYAIQESFGFENLKPTELPDPKPGPGEVLLKVRALSLNYRDLLMIRGQYDPKQPLPLIPCSDAVTEVAAVGDGVSRVEVGNRVCPIFCQNWLAGEPTREKLRSTLGGPLPGTLAEAMVVREEGVVHVPDYLTDEEAATLPCAALTAWSALVTRGGVKAGDTVLVLGTGGVAIFALQIAQMLGARVFITSSSDEKLAQARELGAAEGINYRQEPNWGKRVRELTGGTGVELVVEVGGAETLRESLRAVRFGGQISLIGVLSGVEAPVSIVSILMQHVRVQGILVGHREGFEEMNRAFALHQVRPVIDRIFPFAEAREALEYLASGQHFGKVVVRVS